LDNYTSEFFSNRTNHVKNRIKKADIEIKLSSPFRK